MNNAWRWWKLPRNQERALRWVDFLNGNGKFAYKTRIRIDILVDFGDMSG